MNDLARFTTNEHLKKWVQEVIELTEPKDVHFIDGTEKEYQALILKLKESNTVVGLNESLRPNSYLARSSPDDVARVEARTFIASENEADAGPTNNWQDPSVIKKKLLSLFKGSMRGRTLYVVPYSMGPLNSPYSRVAVEITDSAYVVVNMKIMTRIGTDALKVLGDKPFVKCLHSVGKPLSPNEKDVAWPCNPQETYIVHFPEKDEVWSFGSGYGGNALLNKKCFALRLASVMARREGWLAEHMLIIGVTNPKGEKKYFTGSFPSACGKTNLAMLNSNMKGWKVECVGDDIAWLHFGKDGRLYAINPEAGFFGVAPGTSMKSNPNAMKTIEKNTIFTNVALTDDGDVWWEGMTEERPEHLISWLNADLNKDSKDKAAHPNARFTAPCSQCPSIDKDFEEPLGVPISGIIFGGRRSSTQPLVREAVSWQHGVFLGASMTSETTAAAVGEVGKVRHDPFSMLPFCGYHMGDYFAHWLSQEKPNRKLPNIYYVNWFLKDSDGKFIWPGFSDNMRVIKWMFERGDNEVTAEKTALGYIPKKDSFDLAGLKDVSYEKLFFIDKKAWQEEVKDLENYFKSFGKKLPQAIVTELSALKNGL